jgi:tRNA(Ile2) C34 agmatinyltransferase TiaS
LAVPALLYGCETWAIREQNKYRVTAVEMKFVSRAAKYRWQGYKTNEDILSQLQTNPVVKKIQNYRNKWAQHVLRWTETERQTTDWHT